jgi:hypothetical protein
MQKAPVGCLSVAVHSTRKAALARISRLRGTSSKSDIIQCRVHLFHGRCMAGAVFLSQSSWNRTIKFKYVTGLQYSSTIPIRTLQ